METNRKTRSAASLPAGRIDRRNSIGSLVLLLGLLTVMGQAQISPSDDAYVNSAAPSTNYGAATTLNLQSAADTTFIRFDLTAVPAGYTGSSIAKATLKLYVNSATTAGSFNVDYVIGTWAEKTITSSLQPAIGTTIAASVPLTTASKGKYVEIDVTAAVVEWLNGAQANDGIALVANSPLVATFDSKENTSASHPPELDLVFAGIAGITTGSGSGLTGGGASGTLNLSLLTSCASNQVLQWNGTAWACSSTGTGTVTSVGLFAPTSDFIVSGSPVTSSGALGLNWNVAPTSASTANAIVKRDGTGSFTAAYIAAVGVQGLTSVAGSIGAAGYNTATGNGNSIGVYGQSQDQGYGVLGQNLSSGYGVYGDSSSGTGIFGIGPTGVQGQSTTYGSGGYFLGFDAPSGSGANGSDGIHAFGGNGDALGGGLDGTGGYFQGGIGGNRGIFAGDGIVAEAGSGLAGYFGGNLEITGYIIAGRKDFKIDHPLDPANKYLVHASVESSEMKNIYDGVVTTDAEGEATVRLAEWFEALNTDFRYQLTVIGQFAEAIVANEIQKHEFSIRTNLPNVKVSWQVTGVRQDAFAKAHPLVVEEEKEERLRGFYIHPELHGAPAEKQIEWARHPEMMKQMKERQQKMSKERPKTNQRPK
jgi:hypothetical protein